MYSTVPGISLDKAVLILFSICFPSHRWVKNSKSCHALAAKMAPAAKAQSSRKHHGRFHGYRQLEDPSTCQSVFTQFGAKGHVKLYLPLM